MNGRPPLTPPRGTLSIRSCHLGFLTPRWSSRHSSMTCLETWSTSSFLFTSTISWSSPRMSTIMSSTSGDYSSGYLRIVFSPRWRSASFTNGWFRSWDLSSLPRLWSEDPVKVKAVADWPTPENRRTVQRFLGFTNFYRRLIRNFSQVALSLTDLTSTRTRLSWSSQAKTAFESLKSHLISVPILTTPDPSRQFIVEMDASEVGVGGILFQRSPSDERIHPCAFFSQCLTPPERNYDIENRELLAVKLAM